VRTPAAAEPDSAAPFTQADSDRLAAEKAAAEKTASLIRDDLRELAGLVYDHGLSYAEQLPLSDDEKKFLEHQEKGLVQAQLALEKAVSLIHSPRLRLAVYRSVREFFWCGANMARFAPPLEPTERALALKEEERRKQEARLRGEASGARRREKAAGWQSVALSRAKRIRQTNSGISQNDLADVIRRDWDATKIPVPSHQTLISFLRKCEADATLPRRSVRRKRSPT
jgi:hypothetical protein